MRVDYAKKGNPVKAIGKFINVIKEQLFATPPQTQLAAFRAHLFDINTLRLGVMCCVVVGMDIFSLVVYLVTYLREQSLNTYIPHIIAHICKIIVMALLFAYFYKMNAYGYHVEKWCCRHVDILFIVIYFIGELAVFAYGPQDMGAFASFLAMPFVVGCIPILNQNKAACMGFYIYVASTAYLFLFPSPDLNIYSVPALMNICLVCYIFAVLLSFMVYSAFVNNFVFLLKEKTALLALSEANEQLDYISRQDQLTKLSNRRDYKSYMDQTWADKDARQTLSVMMLDIDYFKRYNDRFGHLMGDECLIAVTSAVSEELEDAHMGPYLFARYGGEEFIVVDYDQNHACMVALGERIRRRIEDIKIENPDSNVSPYVTICVGIATQRANLCDHYNTIIDWADDCLYFAKKNGRNRVIHTAFARAEYKNADNENVLPIINAAALLPCQTLQIESEGSTDCTFIYIRYNNALNFSKEAVDAFHTPNSIPRPDIDKLASFLHIYLEDAERFKNELRACIKNKAPHFAIEMRLKIEDKSPLWVSIRAQCAYSGDGRPEIVYGSVYGMQTMLQFNRFMPNQER
jgi:diguanylate cyclase (GGDEF)-like protein